MLLQSKAPKYNLKSIDIIKFMMMRFDNLKLPEKAYGTIDDAEMPMVRTVPMMTMVPEMPMVIKRIMMSKGTNGPKGYCCAYNFRDA